MKTKVNIRKGNRFFIVLAIASTISLMSCSKDDNSENTIEQSDAVNVITNSLSKQSNGMAFSIETATVYADEQNAYNKQSSLNCGQPYNSNFTESYGNAPYSYSYAVSREVKLNCSNNNEPDNMVYKATRNGSYDVPRMSSNDNSVSNWTITGLSTTSTNAIFNGSYVRNGTQVSKINNNNSFQSTLNYASNNINVNKTTHKIVSGTATVTFIGTSSTGNQSSYNGTITFNGNDTATLVINGNTYTLNL